MFQHINHSNHLGNTNPPANLFIRTGRAINGKDTDNVKLDEADQNRSIIIISRCGNVSVTCDARGNLGPCSVLIQKIPGTDWLLDRWQAASDMGGEIHTVCRNIFNNTRQ